MNVTGDITAAAGEIVGFGGQGALPPIDLAAQFAAAVRASRRGEGGDWDAERALRYALETLRKRKPNDRSPADRHYAVAITDMEKVLAYFQAYVFRSEEVSVLPNCATMIPAGQNGAPLCPYCAEEMVWTHMEMHDGSGWLKGWVCDCQVEDAVTEAIE